MKTLIAIVILIALAALTFWLWTPDLPRSELESRYAAAPSQFIDIDGVRLHVRDTGPRQAPAVILLHGFGSSLHTWDAWSSTLERDRRVIRFDLPGAGLTGADPSGDYSDPRTLRIMLALMDRLAVPRASLVGNSIGGRIAWTFAATYPTRVDKLILVSPDGFASPGFEYGKAPKVPAMLEAMRYVLPKALMRMNLAPAFADPTRLSDELVSRYYDLLLAPGVRAALLARMGQTVLSDPVPMLRRIDCPTLLLWGERDALIPFSNAKDYLRELPHATLHALPALGHVPQEEDPQGSVKAVLRFLDS